MVKCFALFSGYLVIIQSMSKFELQVLGTGAGASQVYDGLPSTGFMLLRDDQPVCLIDLGLGVGRQVIEAFGGFPDTMIITHNHSDHAGDLPVVLRVEQAQGKCCRVIAQQDVVQRLQSYRLAEHAEQIDAQDLADWLPVPTAVKTAIDDDLQVAFFPGEHSELSFGFMLYYNDQPVLAYTADSTLYAPLYEKLHRADTFIIDARPKPNRWHASFEEVKPWLGEGRYIAGHGLSESQMKLYPDLPLLQAGQRIALNTKNSLESES